ncbi:MAG: NAD(P)/FAD-dependent oxidoreductase [Aquabacterium sp.]
MTGGRPRVAVIGSGIAGLATAWQLRDQAEVTLFESGQHFGGHAHTVDLTLSGIRHGVDVGFLVFNHRTYPGLTRLFDELGVATAPSDMSFSVQANGLEWCGSNLNAVFAQRRNLLRPSFMGMLADLVRFNRMAQALAAQLPDPAHVTGQAIDAVAPAALDEPLGAFLERHRFGTRFRDDYLLPMLACIWSCPASQMLEFPLGSMLRFLHNHGLIRVVDRPQWHTVAGGSRAYVQRIVSAVPDARLSMPVRAVRRIPPASHDGAGHAGVWVDTAAGSERFDAAVLACHTDQALALLSDATPLERAVLGAIRWQANRIVLHTDAALLPQRQRAWAAWNYERAALRDQEQARVCLHYLINRLQPLPWRTPVVVSMNPVREPRAEHIHAEFSVTHPVFDQAAIEAQRKLPQIQGQGRVWFAGAWAGWGFHEDGLRAASAVVRDMLDSGLASHQALAA